MNFVLAFTIMFVAGKLFGFLTWAWWQVLSPLWIAPIVWFLAVLFFSAVKIKMEVDHDG